MLIFFNSENFNESGAVSMIFIVCLWLLLLFALGTLQIIRTTQDQIATQSRLDICAVRLTVERKNLLTSLVQSNRLLQISRQTLYALRGVQLLGPVGKIFGGLSEPAVKQIHLSIATYQDTSLRVFNLKEMKNIGCPKNQFSSRPAICIAKPNLSAATRRASTLFPDLKGNINIQSNLFGRITCRTGNNIVTQITLRGDALLTNKNFIETYEK